MEKKKKIFCGCDSDKKLNFMQKLFGEKYLTLIILIVLIIVAILT